MFAAGLDALERAQGQALDVEWAVRKGRVDFLQARAQTRSLDFELAPGQVWTRANAGDVFPELTSASSRDNCAAALDRVMHDMYRRLGAPRPPSSPSRSSSRAGWSSTSKRARAVERGQLPPGVNFDLVHALLVGAVLNTCRFQRQRLSDQELAYIVDLVLAGVEARANRPPKGQGRAGRGRASRS